MTYTVSSGALNQPTSHLLKQKLCADRLTAAFRLNECSGVVQLSEDDTVRARGWATEQCSVDLLTALSHDSSRRRRVRHPFHSLVARSLRRHEARSHS